MPPAPSEPGPAPLYATLRGRFDLSKDQAQPAVIDAEMREGAEFRGTNLWLLIFAIVIASVGLNVNSPAVIIGAMLVSPLMGPIMGAGYGAAVADFPLVRRSALNLGLAVLASLAASAAYFGLTPLQAAHSELLARTSPTLWDVLIALFGGLAGMIGATRTQRSNVLPGVAIATALMPPLCTAGYGIATQNLAYFGGAFYLFCINSVFIAAASFSVARFLRLPEVGHADAAAARRAHRWLLLLVASTGLPSLVLAERLVRREIYTAKADTFLAGAFPPDAARFVVAREVDPGSRTIRVSVVGAPVTDAERQALEAMLPVVGLEDSTLVLRQDEGPQVDVAALREDLVGELYQRTLAELADRERTITDLRSQVASAESAAAEVTRIEREAAAQVGEVRRVVLSSHRAEGATVWVLLLEGASPLPDADRERLTAWLRVRTGSPEVWVVEVPAPAPPP